VDDPTTFTAGIAKPFSLATLKINCRSLPVTTPGFTASAIFPIIVLFIFSNEIVVYFEYIITTSGLKS
jgi:hypothetical protein